MNVSQRIPDGGAVKMTREEIAIEDKRRALAEIEREAELAPEDPEAETRRWWVPLATVLAVPLLGAMIGALIAALAYTPDSGGGTLIDSNRGSLRAG